MMQGLLTRSLLLALALLCTGCSATQLAYNQLDLLARWELGRYLNLDDVQKPVFARHFNETWAWHRKHELPLYAEELRLLAERVGQPLDRAETEAAIARYRDHTQRFMARVSPLACELGPSLSDAQVSRLLAAFDEDIAEYRKKEVDRAAEQRLAESNRQFLRQLRRWLGSLTPEQRKLVGDWNAQRTSVNGEWLAYRLTWRETVAGYLNARDNDAFCPGITALITDGTTLLTETQEKAFAANHEEWLRLFEQLGQTLTDGQRTYLRTRVLALAKDLDTLAAQAPSGP